LFVLTAPPTTDIYPLSLHDALPIYATRSAWHVGAHDANQLACTDCHKLHTDRDPVQAKSTQPDVCFTCHKKQRADFQKASTHPVDRKSTRLNSSHVEISYAVFCLKK